MKRLVALTAIALFVSGPAFAQSEPVATQPAPDGASPVAAEPAAPAAAPAADPNVYQVLRAGDRELGCEELSFEANALNAKLLGDQKSAAPMAANERLWSRQSM